MSKATKDTPGWNYEKPSRQELDNLLDDFAEEACRGTDFEDDPARGLEDYQNAKKQALSAINSLTLKQVLELIGGDEGEFMEAEHDEHIRNQFRAELRQSAERIWKV